MTEIPHLEIAPQDLSNLVNAMSALIGYTRGAARASLSLNDDPEGCGEKHAVNLKQASLKAEESLDVFMEKYFGKT